MAIDTQMIASSWAFRDEGLLQDSHMSMREDSDLCLTLGVAVQFTMSTGT
jgi:hypothetical protein